jgi:uncharacterized low-complexity protein
VSTRASVLVLAAALFASPACDETAPAPEAKTGEAKAGEAKAGEAKAGEAKAGDAKTGDAKAGDAKAEPTPGDGDADVKITGAIETTLTGKIVRCGTTRMEGRLQGGSWRIDDEGIDVAVLALTDEELESPKLVVNVKKPERKSYVPVPGGKLTTAKDRTVAEIDMDMRNIVSKDDRIHVSGKLTCPPK